MSTSHSYRLIVLFWCIALVSTDNSDKAHSRLTSADSGPRVVITPSTSTVYLQPNGLTKVFTCKPVGDQPGMFTQLKWSGPNRSDNYDELRARHLITEEPAKSNTWDLELVKPTYDDSGTYYCQGTYMKTDVHTASINIKIVNGIKIENCHDRQYLVKGRTDGKITCRITGDAPRVTFLKNNTSIEAFRDRYRWDNEESLLIDGEVDTSDAGVYLVKVTNDLTGERRVQTIDVQVHTKPEILPYNSSSDSPEFFGIEGDSAELRCHVTGNPRPVIYWLDPRRRNLTQVGGYHVNSESGTLRIDRVNRVDDHGDFECIALNHIDQVSRKVSMGVYIKPQIVSFDNKTVDEGSEVTFECRSSGYPQPQFSVRKHGTNQTSYKFGDGYTRDVNTVAEGGGSENYVYRVKIMATKSHHGVHYCNATNKAGTAERVGQLFVNHRPDLSLTPSEQFVKLGQKMIVTCHIMAYPEPTVSWFSDNTQVLNVESTFKTSLDGRTHIVTMSPANSQQTAFHRFTCKAENKMGSAEQSIIPRYTTKPGPLTISVLERTPTTVKLQILAPNDGGDRIKYFKYRADGTTLDMHNPVYTFREDKKNETILEASLNPTVPYIIRSLLPYYSYRLRIRAANDAGDGDDTEIRVETTRPTRPEPPVIIKPNNYNQQTPLGVASDYKNGYLLKWSPPDLDNGDPVVKYLIKFNKLQSDSLDVVMDSAEQRIVEQMNERPMHARIGPLETGQRYKVQIQARNKYGDSDPVHLVIRTLDDRPAMPEFQTRTLAWLTGELSTTTLIIILTTAIVLLIFIDIMFCIFCQIGIGYLIRKYCCPSKTNSVVSDANYN